MAGALDRVFPVLVVVSLCHAILCNARCNSDDANALSYFKNDVGSGVTTADGQFASWVTLTDCCLWAGVICNSNGKVIGLNITEDRALTGGSPGNISDPYPLASSLGSLTDLVSINLVNVLFNGRLPDTWGPLTNLKTLVLQSCNLLGAIPQSFVALTSLEVLNLNSNFLNGAVPQGMCNLPKLVSVDLSENPSLSIPSCLGKKG